jgi:hypothetical protein
VERGRIADANVVNRTATEPQQGGQQKRSKTPTEDQPITITITFFRS